VQSLDGIGSYLQQAGWKQLGEIQSFVGEPFLPGKLL